MEDRWRKQIYMGDDISGGCFCCAIFFAVGVFLSRASRSSVTSSSVVPFTLYMNGHNGQMAAIKIRYRTCVENTQAIVRINHIHLSP